MFASFNLVGPVSWARRVYWVLPPEVGQQTGPRVGPAATQPPSRGVLPPLTPLKVSETWFVLAPGTCHREIDTLIWELTMMMTRTARSAQLLAIACLVCWAGSAISLAEPATPLGGPQVTDKVAPGADGTFGGGAAKDKHHATREIPHPMFMAAVRDAIGPTAPESIRASDELTKQVQAIAQDFVKQQREYGANNREALQQMRAEGRGGKGDAKKGTPDAKPEQDSMTDEQRQAMAEKFRELRDKAPKAGDAHTKIWALLSDDQKKAVQAKLDIAKEEMQKQQNERYIENKVGKGGLKGAPGAPAKKSEKEAGKAQEPAKPGASPFAGRPAGAGGNIAPEQRERLMRLFERMTPEQREELLKRIEERMGQGGAGAAVRERLQKKNQPGAGPDGGKPAPTMDDVNVPKPAQP